MACPFSYSLEVRHRAARMVAEMRTDYDIEWAAMKLVATKLGIGTTEVIKPQRLRRPISQAEPATAEWSDWYNRTRLHG